MLHTILLLAKKYNCHINIEVYALVCIVKYILKYIYKGHDCTTMQIGNKEDEVKKYIDPQYIRAPETICCLFGMKMREEVPNVV